VSGKGTSQTRSAILILEDNPVELDAAARTVESLGYEAVRAPDATTAIRLLRARDFLYAILDWDMGRAADGVGTAAPVLKVIDAKKPDEDHPLVMAFLWGAGIGQAHVLAAIREATTRPCRLIDKLEGPDALARELSSLRNRPRIGDLGLVNGVIVHVPCGGTFGHEVGEALFQSYLWERELHLLRNSPRSQAAWRFGQWLTAHHSTVRVRPGRGTGFRRFVVGPPARTYPPCPKEREAIRNAAG